MHSFSKMHALGNDFIVIDATKTPCRMDALFIQKLSDRHTGIGFDQLLILEPSPQADFFMRIFNSDGTEAKQCGNGLRCVAHFIAERSLSFKKNISIETLSGVANIQIEKDTIRVNMGVPQLNPINMPDITAISMGNLHAIMIVASLEDCPVLEIANQLSHHPTFPDGVNVGFMEIIDTRRIHLCTIERGAGRTLSCGSNACAAVVAGIKQGHLDHSVIIELQYGNLYVEWSGLTDSPVFLSGPAVFVFNGSI